MKMARDVNRRAPKHLESVAYFSRFRVLQLLEARWARIRSNWRGLALGLFRSNSQLDEFAVHDNLLV